MNVTLCIYIYIHTHIHEKEGKFKTSISIISECYKIIFFLLNAWIKNLLLVSEFGFHSYITKQRPTQ